MSPEMVIHQWACYTCLLLLATNLTTLLFDCGIRPSLGTFVRRHFILNSLGSAVSTVRGYSPHDVGNGLPAGVPKIRAIHDRSTQDG